MSVRLQHLAGMSCHAYGIRHVVQAVKERDDVVALTTVRGGVCDLEASIGDAGRCGALLGGVDRRWVIVDADERRLRKRLGHQNRAGAMTAADVGDQRALREFVHGAIECRQPRRQEVDVIAGAEETLGPVEQALVMLAPLHALSSAKVLESAVTDMKQIADDRIGAWHVDRSVRVREAQRLLGREEERLVSGVVFDVAAGCLIGQPFANISLVRASFRRERAGRQWPGGECFVEPQLVADRDQNGADRRAEIADRFSQERIETLFINCHMVLPRRLEPGN